MKKIILFLCLITAPLNIYALTHNEATLYGSRNEATLYGSRILVCNNYELKYWKLIQTGNKKDNSIKFLIYDTLKHKSYSLEECSLYKCSPEPDRMYKCKMRDK